MTVDVTAAVRVWSLTNRKIARTFKKHQDVSIAAGDCHVTALCVRGAEIVLGTKDGCIEVFSIGGELLLPAFPRHRGMSDHKPAHADLVTFKHSGKVAPFRFPVL